MPYTLPYTDSMRKTSVYLSDELARRLARIAAAEGRSQAEVLRAAIAAYEPRRASDRRFELARGFDRIDGDPRPVSELSEDELLAGFGR